MKHEEREGACLGITSGPNGQGMSHNGNEDSYNSGLRNIFHEWVLHLPFQHIFEFLTLLQHTQLLTVGWRK
jgi:hypothetical protein